MLQINYIIKTQQKAIKATSKFMLEVEIMLSWLSNNYLRTIDGGGMCRRN